MNREDLQHSESEDPHPHYHKLVFKAGKWVFACGGGRKDTFGESVKMYLLTIELTQMCSAIRRIKENGEEPPKIPTCSMMAFLKTKLTMESSSFAYLNMKSSDAFAESCVPLCIHESQTPYSAWKKEGLQDNISVDSFFVFSCKMMSREMFALCESLHTVIGRDSGSNTWFVFKRDDRNTTLGLHEAYESFFDLLVNVLPAFEYNTNMYMAITCNQNTGDMYRSPQTIESLAKIRNLHETYGKWNQNFPFFSVIKELDGSRLNLR